MEIFTQRFFKKTLCLLCIMLSCLPGLADTTFTVGDWKYTTDGTNTCYVSKCNSTATSIEIPSSVEYNGTTYTVTSIGEYAFMNCSSLTNVTIPNSVKSIGQMAFYECISITSITIPSSVTSIDNYAFAKCSSLTSVTIADRETELSIANAIFQSCQLESVYWGGDYTYTGTLSSRPFKGMTSLKKLEISNKVTKISDDEFFGCSSLENVIIPNSITSIGKSAFYNCTSLTNASIPSSVTSIGEWAFYNCSNLTNISIPSSVTSIGEYAFCGCNSVASITIASSVASIGSSAFSRTNVAKAIWLTNTPPDNYTDVGAAVNYVPNNSYSFSKGTTEIYPYLNSMFEVDGIKYAPVSPSERTCDAIDCEYNSTAANINVGNTVNYNGIEMNVLSIKPYCCYNNRYIKTVVVDNDARSIGTCAFSGCSGITSANIKASEIGDSAFCRSATTDDATFVVDAKTIGSKAFYSCTRLKDMTIGNGTETVGDYAFSGCTALENFSFGTSLSTIGKEAFYGCTAMVKLVANAPVPPTCGTDALNGINKWSCTLYVPNEHIDAYKADAQWKEFFYISPTAVENIAADCNAVEVERYDLNGVRVNEPQRGINIVRMSDGTVRKVMVK